MCPPTDGGASAAAAEELWNDAQPSLERLLGPHLDTLPTTVDAYEVAYLGALMLSAEARREIDHLVTEGDFLREAHRQVYVAVRSLIDDGVPVDVLTVTDRLATSGRLDEVGGPAAVSSLSDLDVCPTPASWAVYGTIVAREAHRRRGIAQLGAARARLEAGEDPTPVIADLCREVAE